MFVYLGIVTFLVIQGSDGQETCLSAWRTQGSCINLSGCEVLLELLRQPRPLPANTLQTLQNSQCGFEGSVPKVCCPPPKAQPTPRPPTTTTTTTATSSSAESPPPDVSNHPNLRFLDNEKCGPITEAKIVGGNRTAVLEFPWMALIAYKRGNRSPEFKCGGTTITTKFILTAAHCVTGLDTGLQLSGVRIGEHNLGTERDCDMEDGVEILCAEKYQDFTIASFYAHDGYQKDKLQNDIALIKLNGEADFRPQNVKPICLPIGSAATLTYSKVIVTGWGATESGYRSQDLLKARIPIVGNDECARIYKNHKIDIWYKQICAGGANRTDSCSGDSGGPLQSPATYINGQPRYIQYGVVSFGPRNCGIEGFPGVYTKVAYYMDWILNTMTD